MDSKQTVEDQDACAGLAAATGSVWSELKDAARGWRKAEMHHAAAVLQAAHPDRLRELQAAEDKALKRLRILVDREPWAEILHELTPNRRAQQPRAENLNAMETKTTHDNREGCAGLAAATGPTFPPLELSENPHRLLYEVAGYLETLRMGRGREVRDESELVGYWQTTDWLLGLKQLGEHCGKVSGLTPEQYMSNGQAHAPATKNL